MSCIVPYTWKVNLSTHLLSVCTHSVFQGLLRAKCLACIICNPHRTLQGSYSHSSLQKRKQILRGQETCPRSRATKWQSQSLNPSVSNSNPVFLLSYEVASNTTWAFSHLPRNSENPTEGQVECFLLSPGPVLGVVCTARPNTSTQCSLPVCVLSCFSRVWVFALRTVALQVPLSMGFSKQGYWSGLPCPPPGDLPYSGIEPEVLKFPALIGGFFTTSATWEAHRTVIMGKLYSMGQVTASLL